MNQLSVLKQIIREFPNSLFQVIYKKINDKTNLLLLYKVFCTTNPYTVKRFFIQSLGGNIVPNRHTQNQLFISNTVKRMKMIQFV